MACIARRRKPVKWGEIGQKVVDLDAQRRLNKRNAEFYRSFEYEDLESYKEMRSSGRLRLERFEAAWRYFFEHSEIRLGEHQKTIIQNAKIGLLQKIFGDDLLSNIEWLKAKFQFDELVDTIAILLPRRSGKTVAMAILTAIIAVSFPAGNSIVYNLTARQAEEFMAEANKHLKVFQDSDEFGWTEVKRDVRKLMEIHVNALGTTSSIKSYPSALNGDAKIDQDP